MLLAKYQGDDNYYEVNIDFLIKIISEMPSKPWSGYKWEDKRVKQALQAIKAAGINTGMLNVRRGRKGDGLDLTNKLPRPWQSSGFAQSQWISKPKKDYPNLPTLVVMYEKGEKNRDWDNQALYLPTLILPKNNFVFMFNYSEEVEEKDDDEDY